MEKNDHTALADAAPYLLEALKAMLHGLRSPVSIEDHNAEREEACRMARAAIARADGARPSAFNELMGALCAVDAAQARARRELGE